MNINNCILENISAYNESDFSMYPMVAYVYSNVVYLICGKTGGMLEVIPEIYNDIKNHNIDENVKFKMVQRGLAKSHESRDVFEPLNMFKPNFFIVDLTNKCNLNCVYCFRNYTEKNSYSINEIQLSKICNYIYHYALDNHLKQVTIQPWGGEPFLEFEKIEQIYNFFKDKDVKANISIETNGTLITEEIARKCVDHHYGIGLVTLVTRLKRECRG